MTSPNKNQPDIFADPTLTAPGADDPFAVFISTYWKKLLAVLLAAGVIFYGYNAFQDTRNASQARAADLYSRVRVSYQETIKLEEDFQKAKTALAEVKGAADAPERVEAQKLLDESKAKFTDSLAKLKQVVQALGDTREPYAKIAGIYSQLLERLVAETEGRKATVMAGEDFTKLAADSNERFIAELNAVVRARVMLEDDATYEEGKNLLKSLAKSGSFVRVAAASSLAHLVRNPEEKKETAALLQQIIAEQPEQADLLEKDLASVR